MRQTHVAGEKLFVDWAGHTVPIFDLTTGEVHAAHLFVAALGASSYVYSERRWTETLPDWIGAHVNTFDFLGGVPKAVVPDNPKVAVIKPSRYEPGINRTYQDLADHYGFVVLPARVRRPRDKAKVENAVGVVSRDDRHARRSTIVTSQVPVKHWHELIADPTIADAVLDRLVHTAHRLELEGPSLRDPKSARPLVASATSPTTAAQDTKSAKGAKK